ncbi:MAG: hypothetical protein AUG51_13195 [Acidobacteria bacterium 13_1_20CM_3_53_8]|nr:MAG: hypothetical protein AUG51_13195 [Acidobacteria bacterium 13_1_20CM_3_53_8]
MKGKNRGIKLSEVLPNLKKEIEKAGKSIRPINQNSRWSKKRAYTLLLLENYIEVLLIFKRILDSLNELADIKSRVKFDEIPEDERAEREALMMRTFDLLAFLRLDIKALYIWTAQITDIFKDSGVKIDLEELNRISLFRHKLITHVHETPFFKSSLTTKSGTTYNPKEEFIEDMYLPFDFRNSRFVGLQTLVRKATSFIPELGQEKNRFERIKILYRQVNKIADNELKRNVKKFIFKVGLPTDSPGIIAVALLQALKNYRRS